MTKKNHFDVLIIGTGPAGSVCAYEIKKTCPDLAVLLIDKEKIPRYKVCGGGVQIKSAKILPFDIESVIEDVIFGIIFSYKCKKWFMRTYDEPLIYNVMRDRFDAFLTQKAQEIGALLLDGCTVKKIEIEKGKVLVKTDKSFFSGDILIGADGAGGITAKSLGLMQNTSFSIAIESEVNVAAEVLKKYKGFITIDCGTLKSGYAWIFPKSDHLSIGAGTSKEYAVFLKEYYKQYLRYQNIGFYNTVSFKGFLLPHRQSGSDIQTQNVLLVGDAAGLVDAFTGEGIYYAIRSAQLAASSVIKKLKGHKNDLKDYQNAVDQELMPELISAQQLLKLFNLAPRVTLKLLQSSDSFWQAICKILRGEKTYKSYIDAHLHLFQFFIKLTNVVPKWLRF